jgi:hypothetical protein
VAASLYRNLLTQLDIFRVLILRVNLRPLLLIQIEFPKIIKLLVFKCSASENVHESFVDARRVAVSRTWFVTPALYLCPCLLLKVVDDERVTIHTSDETTENVHESLIW